MLQRRFLSTRKNRSSARRTKSTQPMKNEI
jgi:hypothetical protein